MTQVTIIGNLASAVELRFTPQGKAVANFSVAESSRVKDAQGNWVDGPATFWRVQLWDSAAENLAESLDKGQRVIVVGEAKQRSFEANGEKRTVIEVTASEVGPSLRWATAKVTRSGKSAPKAAPAEDPWGAPQSAESDPSSPPF